MKPVISVILTAGDGVETYHKNLAGQTFKEFEIIDADRVTGLEKAQGEYILFADGSEVYPDGMLEKMYAEAEQSGADMVISNCELIDSDGEKTFRRGIHSEWVHGGKQIFNWMDSRGRIMNVVRPLVGNKLYRKQFIIDAGLGIAGCDSEAIYSAIGAVAAEKIAYISNLTFSRNVVPESEAEKLPDVLKTVDCVTEHVKGMADRADLWNAVMYFAIRQYVDNYEKYCRELDSAERIEFYEKAHSVFNSEIFDGLTEKGLNDDKLFRKYSIIKKHDSSELKKLKTRRIIVSLTSYPARIAGIAQMLESIYSQTRKADKIVLWLVEEQFPNKDDDLPDDLRKLQFYDKLEVRWCDDLKPHKKYFYALQEFTDDVVVTIDDDLQYPPYMLENLYMSYLQYPEAVSAVRTHWMVISDKGQLIPYRYWMKETVACLYSPKMQLFATGGAGTLYPPGIYDDKWFDKDKMVEMCLWADDIWLKLIEIMSGVPVVAAMPCEDLRYLPGSQGVGLYHKNVDADQNDVQLQKIEEWLKPEYGDNALAKKILEYDGEPVEDALIRVCECHEKERRELRDEIGRNSRQLKKRIEENERAYREKSEINAKLQRTYKEKSEINAKLQQTYKEKADRGIRIKELEKEKSDLQAKLGELQIEKADIQKKLEQLQAENVVLQKQRSIWYKIKN